jgi:hypothetical protein
MGRASRGEVLRKRRVPMISNGIASAFIADDEEELTKHDRSLDTFLVLSFTF